MKGKESKKAEKAAAASDILDGGMVATGVTLAMRNQLHAVAKQMDRTPAWVIREALKQYFASFGGAA